jgi:hypothetical protein
VVKGARGEGVTHGVGGLDVLADQRHLRRSLRRVGMAGYVMARYGLAAGDRGRGSVYNVNESQVDEQRTGCAALL